MAGTFTGIGHASAKVLIGRGFRVFGSVRKQADADRLGRNAARPAVLIGKPPGLLPKRGWGVRLPPEQAADYWQCRLNRG